MSQQTAVVQTSTGSEITPALGNLQSVGPTNQTLPVISAMQSNNSVPILQPQTQNQQSQYTSQTSKQQTAQHSSVSSSCNDFPQVCKKILI